MGRAIALNQRRSYVTRISSVFLTVSKEPTEGRAAPDYIFAIEKDASSEASFFICNGVLPFVIT
jgi:hypothetical protein